MRVVSRASRIRRASIVLSLSAAACSSAAPSGQTQPAAGSFVLRSVDAGTPDAQPRAACDSSFRALARMLFVREGCVDATCHTTPGPDTPAAGLDLTEDDAYAALIDVPARAPLEQPLTRVKPGASAQSFLYLKLAAALPAGPKLPPGGGSPMPLDRPPLSAAALSALDAWIRAGAPRTGVVPGGESLVEACQQSEP